ncbi:hypothetical protein KR067_008168 [Drosophila pandora]|nr:hypothetical protein KR067_008168 [Drosophila pandora]
MNITSPTPSVASTYVSELEQEYDCSQKRRSLRLIEKESRSSTDSSLRCTSPQLFGETQDEDSQKSCQQLCPTKIVHLKNVGKASPSEKILRFKPDEVQSLTRSTRILHLKQGRDEKKVPSKASQEAANKSVNRKRKAATQPKGKPGRKRKLPAEAQTSSLSKSMDQPFLLDTSPSTSKLPLHYPAHFVHQLPPIQDKSLVRHKPLATPPVHLQELSPTPESTPLAATLGPSPPDVDSDSSMTISLSDSIGEIFGTKDICTILNVECPRQYILIEEHLPAMATMLNVELSRLRSVLDITQRLTHEQIVQLPMKQDSQVQLNLIN